MPAAVIVAEPETSTRGFLERHLADDGFQVLGASAPAEALELAEQVRPDLVLVTELELCLRLRAGEPGRSCANPGGAAADGAARHGRPPGR
jgi:DNA-binding response OmpR family regulator